MTDKLISLQAAKTALSSCTILEWEQLKKCYPMLEVLEELPSAQPEIVLCKDCKHYRPNLTCVEGHYNGCAMWLDNGNEIMVAPDDYCSYAERREE